MGRKGKEKSTANTDAPGFDDCIFPGRGRMKIRVGLSMAGHDRLAGDGKLYRTPQAFTPPPLSPINSGESFYVHFPCMEHRANPLNTPLRFQEDSGGGLEARHIRLRALPLESPEFVCT